MSALTQFKAAKSYRDAEAAWTDFLIACGSFFSKLQEGAKGANASEYWYGLKKHQRKSDPILNYLHKARNSDEHGIEYVTARGDDGGFNLGFGEKKEFIIQAVDPDTLLPIDDPGLISKGWSYGPHVKLIRVFDRKHKTFCDPPYSAIFPGADPAVVGDDALEKLAEILREAEGMLQH